MSGKSVLFSILSIISLVAVIFGIAFIFKTTNIGFGFLSILLLFIPALFQRKALSEADGTADKILAKFIVPVLALLITFLAVMSVAFWIQW